MSFSLLPYIFNSCWFISEGSVQGLLPIVKSIYKGEIPKINAEEKLKHQMSQVVSNSADDSAIDNIPNKKHIAVIPVFDIITLQDQLCGPTGTLTKSKFLDSAGQDTEVEGVILFIDSPGGEAHAMFQFTNAIKEFKANYKKPIVAFVGSMAASAAYGIAATCDKIVVSDTHSMLGSIGTYITVFDHKKSLESEGIFIHEIYASDSSNKNIEWRAAIAGDEKPMLKMLKSFNDRFISIVKDGRPEIKDTVNIKPFTGSIIFGSDAITLGMADVIGNMNIALDLCKKINKSNYSQNYTEMKIPFKSAWTALAAMFSTKAEGDDLTEADVEQMNIELESIQNKIETLTNDLSAKDKEIANLIQQMTEAKNANDILQAALTKTEEALNAANIELANRPGSAATTANIDVEEIDTPDDIKYDEVNEYVKSFNK